MLGFRRTRRNRSCITWKRTWWWINTWQINCYKELGDNHFNKMDKEKIKNYMINRLEKPGYKVLIPVVEEKKAA